MKRFIFFFAVLIISNSLYSQKLPDKKKILEYADNIAKAYLLSANRPSYYVNAYVTEKNQLDLSISFLGDNYIFELPVSVHYGVFNNFEIFVDAVMLNSTYNFAGEKITGFGDIGAGLAYQFQNSKHFAHSLQAVVKIPVADKDKELGTGYFDYHLGLAQNYFQNSWGYDLSLQLGFLKRRDFPLTNSNLPPAMIKSIDSLKQSYNYTFEPELSLSLGPYFSFSDNFMAYTGFAFSRNTKLKFNSADIYSGFGFNISKKSSIGLGLSIGILNSSEWSLSAYYSLNISLK